MSTLKMTLALGLMTLLTAGCDSRDERLTDFATRANEQQSQQNQQFAALQQESATTLRRVIEMESASRTEFAAIQQQTQNLSAQIAREREELEAERRQLARERQTAPLVAEAIRSASLLAACLLPMLLGIYLLMPVSPQAQTEALASLLIEQLAESPRGVAPARLTASLSE